MLSSATDWLNRGSPDMLHPQAADHESRCMSDQSRPILELDLVSRRFGDRYAVREVSLDIRRGEVVCLVGPSGCGKSTLLRLIAGVDVPDSGRILLDGQEIAGPSRFVEPEDRRVGFMFQDYALFPHLTVRDNILFGLRHLPKPRAGAQADSIIRRIGIGELAARHPHELSGGEQQRVALARALAPQPLVLLMDEPFSNLDRRLREHVRMESLATLRDADATAVIVTHDPEEAMSIGDRVVLMRAGQVVQIGTGYSLYDRPGSIYAARFLGPCNQIPARIRGGCAETVLGAFPAPGFAEGAPAVVCIRPKALFPVAICDERRGADLRGTLVQRSFLGEVEQLTLRVEGLDAPLRLRTSQRLDTLPGEIVRFGVDAGQAIVLPPEKEPAAVAMA